MKRLWIPGWQMDKSCFDALKTQLSAMDETTLNYQIPSIDLESWLEQESRKIIEPTEIVGWSLGGSLAYMLASRNPLVKKLWLLNTNVEFYGQYGLASEVALNFMARYQKNATVTRKRFANLVDSNRSHLIQPYFVEGDHALTLQWLYDFNAGEYNTSAVCHILLGSDDQLVPAQLAKAAWQAQSVNSIDIVNAQHSLPLFESDLVVRWMQSYG